ncbi:echinoderm microtubule-associated protein-like 4 [Lates japonicus]|uniref:Echinoderm microtubule-associated protein-like 4 n=1 Tax=Lates japonicus TaxID=270547 RepID=A0AAD3MKU1_LATJO|nr:echinoderm microtubule-associated protein-like 4 [Lates japonicus]
MLQLWDFEILYQVFLMAYCGTLILQYCVWPEGSDGTDINALIRSHNRKVIALADDFSVKFTCSPTHAPPPRLPAISHPSPTSHAAHFGKRALPDCQQDPETLPTPPPIELAPPASELTPPRSESTQPPSDSTVSLKDSLEPRRPRDHTDEGLPPLIDTESVCV